MRGGNSIAVIGGGFVGLCCALHLQRIGQSVTLVDPGDPVRAASYGNSGQFAVGEVVPLAVPGVLYSVPKWLLDPLGPLAIRWRDVPALIPWLARFLSAARQPRMESVSSAMAALCDLIHFDYEPLLTAAAAHDVVVNKSCIRLYETRQHWEREHVTWQLRERAGLRYELLDGEALRAREPEIDPRFGFGVVMEGRTFIKNPLRLMQAFAACFERQGGVVLEGEVVDFTHYGNRVDAIRLTDGRHLAVAGVVIAAGAWSKALCRRLGDRVPLECERGYHVMLPQPEVRLGCSLTLPSRGFGLVPMEGGLRVAGTVELARVDAPPNFARADRLIENARLVFPRLNIEGATRWMGNRPSLPDSLPVIDRASRFANAYYAFGHGHMGVSWAATTGRLIAGLVGNRPLNFDLSPYRLARF